MGGGYKYLEEYILKVARYECLKIHHIMKKKNLEFKAAVCAILEDHKATTKIRNKFLKS